MNLSEVAARVRALGEVLQVPLDGSAEPIAAFVAGNSKVARELRRVLYIPFPELLGCQQDPLSIEQAMVEAERCIRCIQPVCRLGPVDGYQVKRVLVRLARGDVEEARQMVLRLRFIEEVDSRHMPCVLDDLLGPGAGVDALRIFRTLRGDSIGSAAP